MKQPFQDQPTDNTGARILGNPNQGCPHCNHTEVHYSTNGKIAWYHPGTLCCKPAIKQQLTWRQNDLDRLTTSLHNRKQQLQQLIQQTNNLTGKEKHDAKKEIHKLTQAIEHQSKTNHYKLHGHPNDDIPGLLEEIKELQTLLKNWQS